MARFHAVTDRLGQRGQPGFQRFECGMIWAWLRQHRGGEARHDAEMVLRTFARDVVDEAPTPIHRMAEWMGVQVRTTPQLPFSGQLATEPAPLVTLRAAESVPLQRWALAHELGHLMLHDGTTFDQDVSAPGFLRSPQEREANLFAAGLLLPVWEFVPAVRRIGYDTRKLAALFEVTEIAVNYRLTTLGMV